jgi:hypothetical protein
MLVTLMSSLCRNGLARLGLPWLARWFSLLSSSLDNAAREFRRAHPHSAYALEAQLLRELRSLPLIPLEDGTFRAVDGGPVWLPASMDHFSYKPTREHGSEGGGQGQGKEGGGGGAVSAAAFLAEFPLVGKSLTTVATGLILDGGKSTPGVVGMLRKLGVEPLSAHQVVEGHVLPSLLGGGGEDLQPDALVQYARFVKKHAEGGCAKCNSGGDPVRNMHGGQLAGTWLGEKLRRGGVPVLLQSRGVVRTNSAAVHFSRRMGSPVDLVDLCPGVAWNIVSEKYLETARVENCLETAQTGDLPEKKAAQREGGDTGAEPESFKGGAVNSLTEVASWRAFWGALGVTDLFKVEAVEVEVNDVERSVWKGCDWGAARGPLLVGDWRCQEFEAVVQALTADTDLSRLGQLAEAMDRCWETDYKGCTEATWIYASERQSSPSEKQTSAQNNASREHGDVFPRWLPSSFALQLRTLAWLPARVHHSDAALRCPTSLFCDCPSVQNVLGRLGAYPAVELRDEAFVEVLGLRNSVTAGDVLAVLGDVVQEGAPTSLRWACQRCDSITI